jgi:uncharacterized membrane protein
LRVIALLAFLGVVYFIFYKSPYKELGTYELATWDIIIFEIILFVFLSAIFSILLFWLRRTGKKGLMKSSEIFILGMISVRQGILLAFCAIIF